MAGPGIRHEARREVLHALAVLTGYTLALPVALPDGRAPDVVRLHSQRRSLFVGDAKDSEEPSGTWTRVRLLGYIRWFVAEAMRPGSDGAFVVCFGARGDARRWRETLQSLAREVGLEDVDVAQQDLGDGFICAWFRAHGSAGSP